MPFNRVNPFLDMEKMTKDIDDFFESNFKGGNKPRVQFGDFSPRVDIIEDEKQVIFQAEIPGVEKEQVKVSVNDDNTLTLKGEKKFNKEGISTCCKNERQFGSFSRSFQLPEQLDADNIEAKYENGVLFLTIPKMEPVKPKEREISIS